MVMSVSAGNRVNNLKYREADGSTRLLCVSLHVFVAQIRIHLYDVVRSALGQDRRRFALRILNVFLDERYTQQFLLLSPRAAAGSRLCIRNTDVEKRIEFLERARVA